MIFFSEAFGGSKLNADLTASLRSYKESQHNKLFSLGKTWTNDHNLIINTILEEGFEISAMQMFNLDKPTAQEFLEIYRGVLPEYIPITEQMTTGPCIVMEVRQENAVAQFRQLAGPMDPEIAKNLRPNTLRARFGVDRVKNAIHSTDLPEDGVLESQYFF